MKSPVISVLGAGSYGTALAITLSRFGNPVLLWGHDPADISVLKKERKNQKYLPDIDFPEDLIIEDDLKKAVTACKDILVVVPSQAFASVLQQIKPYLSPESRIVWATKGLEPGTGRLFYDVAQSILGQERTLAMVSGPTFAKELAKCMPTAIDIASNDEAFSDDLQVLFNTSHNLTAYRCSDLVGVQLGGVIKNVIAIGVGMSDGVGYGANARISLITRGLSEMAKLGVALGAEEKTFMGMSGLGDLILTCTDNQSRNRRFGLLIGEGKSIAEAETIIQQVVEGYHNVKEVWLMAQKKGIETPIINEVYQVLYGNKNPHDAAVTLFNYDKE